MEYQSAAASNLGTERDDHYFNQWFNQIMNDLEYEEYLNHKEWCPICGAWWEDAHDENCQYA